MQQQDDAPFDVEPKIAHKFVNRVGTIVLEFNDEDIVAFQASQKYVEAILRPGFQRNAVLDQSLKTLHAQPEYADAFVQIHRATLVRLSELVEVRRLSATATFTAHLSTGHTFPVSRRYAAALRRLLRDRKVGVTHDD